jgi:hypothetical protein
MKHLIRNSKQYFLGSLLEMILWMRLNPMSEGGLWLAVAVAVALSLVVQSLASGVNPGILV